MIRIVHIIAIVIAGIMFLATILMYRRKKLNIQASIIWSFIWIGMIIGTLLFDRLRGFAISGLSIEPIDMFTVTAIIILFIMSFSQFNQIKQNQKQIEEIVESIALREGKIASRKKSGK